MTACKWDSVIPLDKLWKQYERIIKDNGAIVLTATQPFTSELVMSNSKLFKHEWIWEKQKANNFMSAKYQPLKYHENVLVFGKDRVNFYPQKYKVLEVEEIMEMNKKEITNLMRMRDYDRFGKVDRRKTINDCKSNKDYLGTKVIRNRAKDTGYRNPKSVLKINKEINGLIHPTQKPVALFEYLIKTYTNEGETVLDNCMGSGTTAIACMNTNRNYIGFELDKNYFELANERIKKHDKQIESFTLQE
ncbi:site-specific DNA-methyltransferase [Staphylococcus epidermidis]|nr:site-specific DNA-methyltransferase [Staphylococcus epidermidis]NAM65874.1 site-specific DNA-methyltransferase [Staphylococcus epidermidis]NAM77744.1 site-specific DNA-methyltransferase [Staphylococcus epidermidis]